MLYKSSRKNLRDEEPITNSVNDRQSFFDNLFTSKSRRKEQMEKGLSRCPSLSHLIIKPDNNNNSSTTTIREQLDNAIRKRQHATGQCSPSLDDSIKDSKRSLVKDLNKSRVGLETINFTKNYFQDIISSKAKGNKDKDFWKKLENALEKGLIFQNLCMRLPIRSHLEEMGWVEQNVANLKVTMINPTFPGMTHAECNKKIVACARVRNLETRFKEARPNLIMAKKGNFDWENLLPEQKVNHFRYVSMTTKDLLTLNLLDYYKSKPIPYYPTSMLYDIESDMDNVEMQYYKSLILAFSQLIVILQEQMAAIGHLNWLMQVCIPKSDKETLRIQRFYSDQIDKFPEIERTTENESQWKHFDQFYRDLRDGTHYTVINDDIILKSKSFLKRQGEPSAGHRNLWIVKPCVSSRGRGIKVHNNLQEMAAYIKDVQSDQAEKQAKKDEGDNMSHPRCKPTTVLIQKYIERPLIIHRRKFDIRQWLMVTSFEPVQAWIYDGCYLRFSGDDFDLDNLDDYIHLTNHSVQVTKIKKNRSSWESMLEDQTSASEIQFLKTQSPSIRNNRRLKERAHMKDYEYVPQSFIWSLSVFKSWLGERQLQNENSGQNSDSDWDSFNFDEEEKQRDSLGNGIWNEQIFPQMKEILAETIKANADTCDQRQNTFEFFGADFMLTDDLNVILLEINRSPDPSNNTRYQREMFDNLARDTCRVLYEFPDNPNSGTGGFQSII